MYATDDQGFTALHWALVKGSQGSIQKLLEYGADRFAKNNDGKTPAVTAEEMSTVRQWRAALSQAGYNKDATPKEFPVPGVKDTRWFISRFIFFWPFLILLVALYMASHYPIYVGLPLAIGIAYGMPWAAQKLLGWAPANMRNIEHTVCTTVTSLESVLTSFSLSWPVSLPVPYFGLWCGGLPLSCLVSYPHSLARLRLINSGTIRTDFFMNVCIAALFGSTIYFYFFTMSSDPGFVPKSASRSASKAVIDELMEARSFDENHFCVHCMVRKPLRSKHCKRCERCVAKTDQ